jgi:hypothetical protein
VARDSLSRLVGIRQEAVEGTLRGLAACLAAEGAAAAVVATLADAVTAERLAADRDGQANEAFAAWSASVRSRRRDALAALARAEADTVRARGVVASARADAQAVGVLIESRTFRMKAEAERREGHALDDIARAQRWARARAVQQNERSIGGDDPSGSGGKGR